MSRSLRVAVVSMALALIGTAGVVATPASAVSKPASPAVASASGNGWVAVKWSAAAANGKAVLGYQVATRRYWSSSGKWSAFVYTSVGSTARSRAVGYPNGAKVQLLVRARNAVGYGPWGSAVTTAGLPSVVPGVKGVAGDRTAKIMWSAAASNGSAITSYRIYFRSATNGTYSNWYYRSTGASTRAFTFTGLGNGQKFQFEVRALNSRGIGAPGTRLSLTPVAATKPVETPPPSAPPTTPPATTPPVTAPPTTTPPTSTPPTTPPPSTPALPHEVQQILDDTNAFRAENDLAPLVAMPALNAIAGDWAKSMHDTCTFEHRSSFSVYPSGWRRAGENIAAGYSSTNVVQGWIDSPGHRANMLGDYTHIGVGYYQGSNCYRTYFVQNFAKY